MKSIEEKIEDMIKSELNVYKINYFIKTASMNEQIDDALKKAESKSGGKGGNRPDIRCFLDCGCNRKIPVIIEVKGTK